MTLAGQAPAGQEHSAAPFSMRRIGNTDHGNNDADIYEVTSAKGRVLVPVARKCDAMLFRAAPDLLEAAELALEAFDSAPSHFIRDNVNSILALRAAIYRATGSQP